MRRRIRIALQLLTAAPLDKEMSSMKVYNILKSEANVLIWLWDRSGTGDFESSKQQHFDLALKIAKKHKLGKNYVEQEESASEIVDRSVRGYYFPKSNQIAIYPIKVGRRYMEPKEDVLKLVSSKLNSQMNVKIEPNLTGIAIQDEYNILASKGEEDE